MPVTQLVATTLDLLCDSSFMAPRFTSDAKPTLGQLLLEIHAWNHPTSDSNKDEIATFSNHLGPYAHLPKYLNPAPSPFNSLISFPLPTQPNPAHTNRNPSHNLWPFHTLLTSDLPVSKHLHRRLLILHGSQHQTGPGPTMALDKRRGGISMLPVCGC